MDRTDGLLVLDKPSGITSRDAVDRALRWFPRRTKMGHTGTLDPLATGVLVLCFGGTTRLAEYVQRMAKTYRSTFHFGARSDSDDADGRITTAEGAAPPEKRAVEAELHTFLGTFEQVPPAYSAAKVTGQRAYDLARRGQEVNLQPRPVTIYGIDLLRYEYPELEVEVRCGKGTYIRSLARDLGERLGCGAYVQVLRRTRVGPFGVEEGLQLDAPSEEARKRLLPAALALADLPRVELKAEEGDSFRRGQGVNLPVGVGQGGEVGVFEISGKLLGVGEVDSALRLRPTKVLG